MWHDVKALNATASGLVALSLLACAAGGVWWLATRPVFDLRAIRIETMDKSELKHVSQVALRSGTQGRLVGNFFTANLEQVRQVFESVPWVRRASVRREWPDRLIVSLEEHEALGTWGDDGRLLSVKGDVFVANFAEAVDPESKVPEFDGPDGSEKEVLARYHELKKWFAPASLQPQAVSLSGRYAWTVKLDNGATVALGREQTHDMLRQRVERLVRIWPQLESRVARIDTIDMRYQNGLALSAAGLKIPSETKKH